MSMTLGEASKFFKLGADVLKELVERGLIDNPLSQIDIDALALFQHTWGDDKFLHMQLMEKSPVKRKQLIDPRKNLSRVEKYIYGRFFNLKSGERLSVDLVAIELRTHFGIPLKKTITGQIIEIRKIAQADRKKSIQKSTR